ncbi:MAG: dihydrofolate reductase family protein [Sphingomonadaceae bacterium]
MARRIIAAAFVSLDGVMQSPGGSVEDTTDGFDEGGWVFRLWDEGVNETLGALFAREYDLLLGRRTYDIFAAYWPYVEGEEAAMGAAFTKANKYVLTRGGLPLDWENTHRLSSIVDVAKLKDGDGPDLIIQGSSTLYPALLAEGLIDELTLLIYPVVIGKGKRLFGDGTVPAALRMTSHRVTAKGTIIATYEQAGVIPPLPDFAPAPATSARETERQRKMKEGIW